MNILEENDNCWCGSGKIYKDCHMGGKKDSTGQRLLYERTGKINLSPFSMSSVRRARAHTYYRQRQILAAIPCGHKNLPVRSRYA
jgi:hypothetical protein